MFGRPDRKSAHVHRRRNVHHRQQADEYSRLIDASAEITNVDNEKDDDSEIIVDRYLKDTVDRQPSSLENWNAEKASKIELKQLSAGLKYAFLYNKS